MLNNRDLMRQWINGIALVVMLVVNAAANIVPLNGLETGAISDMFPVYFVPAGYVFSIWGLIYVALIGFVIFQARPSQRENPLLRRIGYWFALSCAANSLWIFAWHWLVFPLTLVLMLVLLFALIQIYRIAGNGRVRRSRAETWLVQIPFSIYLGWITVATIANVTDVLYNAGWNGGGIAPQTWAVIMLVIAAVLGLVFVFRHSDIAYIAVLVWAFIGIAVKHGDVTIVAGTALAAAAVVAAGLVIQRLTMQPSYTTLNPAGQ
jgi:benzodiazapine receptor